MSAIIPEFPILFRVYIYGPINSIPLRGDVHPTGSKCAVSARARAVRYAAKWVKVQVFANAVLSYRGLITVDESCKYESEEVTQDNSDNMVRVQVYVCIMHDTFGRVKIFQDERFCLLTLEELGWAYV